jgi:hypothetical protein
VVAELELALDLEVERVRHDPVVERYRRHRQTDRGGLHRRVGVRHEGLQAPGAALVVELRVVLGSVVVEQTDRGEDVSLQLAHAPGEAQRASTGELVLDAPVHEARAETRVVAPVGTVEGGAFLVAEVVAHVVARRHLDGRRAEALGGGHVDERGIWSDAGPDLEAGQVARPPGDDVDRAEKRVGAVGGRAGPEDDLDPFDLGQRDVEPLPQDRPEEVEIDRPPVDHHEHPGGALRVEPAGRHVHVGPRESHDLQAGHDLEQLGNARGSRGLDLLGRDDRDRLRHVEERLLDPARAHDDRNLVEEHRLRREFAVRRNCIRAVGPRAYSQQSTDQPVVHSHGRPPGARSADPR